MSRGSPIPPMLRQKIVEQHQKGVSQRKIPKSFKFSSSTVHHIIQRFRESGTISVREGEGWKTILDARDLQALRRHCITYRNAAVMEITTWAQENFQKTLLVNTIHRAIHRRRLQLYRRGLVSEAHYEQAEGNIYCCGLLSTRKSDCTGLPTSMLRNSEGPQQRGQSHIKMKGNMSLISWYNKGNFRFLSNAYSPIKQVAAHGPQVPDRPPQQDDEEATKERDHGGREEGPPHALAIAVTRYFRKNRDEQAG
ncbi:piggyBac transposable element-derived protein 5 [Silurus meridionalis]|nr:piggyBac transposable element-derived protein 5 [Silurus meridionalis]